MNESVGKGYGDAARRLRRSVALFATAALVAGLAVVVAPNAPEARAATGTLPRTALADGVIDRWNLAGPQSVAAIGPEVGSAKSGTIALRVDAPVVSRTKTVAWVKSKVEPGRTYTFTAYARVLSAKTVSTGARFKVGRTTMSLPKLNATWKKVTWRYKTDENETSLNVALRLSKAVKGLAIDGVTLRAVAGAKKGTNVVPNGSFERVATSRGIVSTSLVMTTKTAAVAVALPAGKITWVASRSGKSVAKGTVTMKGSITAMKLPKAVTQGIYTLKVTASDKKVIKTTMALIDSPTPWIYQDERYGVALHVERSTYDGAAGYARALGISAVRNDIHWRLVETKKNTYDFGLYDAPFGEMRAHGLKILGIVGYGNPIYGQSNAAAPTTSKGIKAYGTYAATVAKHYKLAGMEVFNEFNWPDHNKSSCRTSTCYSKLVASVGAAVAKVAPKLPIVVGSTAKYQPAWFNHLWARGAMAHTDAMSFHPYEITGKPEALAGLMDKARASMKKHGKKTKPIWITELGTSSRTGNRTTTEQASVLLRTSVTAFASGAKKFYWYDLINDGPDKADQESNFGLYSHPVKNVSAVAPKRAGFVQALTIAQLGGRSFRASENLGTGVVSHAFGGKTNTVRVVWAPKGTKTATIKTNSSVVVVTSSGNTKTVKAKNGAIKIKVTQNPVFVRSGSAKAGVAK